MIVARPQTSLYLYLMWLASVCILQAEWVAAQNDAPVSQVTSSQVTSSQVTSSLPTDTVESAVPLAEQIDRVLAREYFGPPIPLSSSAEFHRRIYFDLIGRGPTVDESQEYFRRIEADPASEPAIRKLVIDELLDRPEFSRYYAAVIEVMFTERRETITTLESRTWIRQWLQDRRPLNELCTEVLASDGTGGQLRGAASFIINRQADPNLVTRDVGRIFFGRDVKCAQCHDHPLVADYEQAEYFGILSFVNRTYLFQDPKRGNLPFLGEKGEGSLEFTSVFRPEDGKSIAQPVLPTAMAMDAEPGFVDAADTYVVAPGKDQRGVPRYSRRQQLAVLATHPENIAFNRNLANRLWANMMGVGVVHPVDMHHSDNPPISAALLRLLSDALVHSQYDLREFLRQVARSDAYQKSVGAPDLQNWSGPSGGAQWLDQVLSELDKEHRLLKPQMEMMAAELARATKQIEKAQADVSKLDAQIDQAKKRLQEIVEQRDKDTKKLSELEANQTKQKQLIESLQASLNEADKVLKLTPADSELVAARALLQSRLTMATEAKPPLDNARDEQQEIVDDSTNLVNDQRNRILALANRKLALGEFVVEARGVQRGVRKQMQALMDAESDLEQRASHLAALRQWLDLRDTGDQVKLEQKQAELIGSWRRSFAVHPLRALNPEQMAGATYFALEMDRSVRAKALADWANNHKDQPAELADMAKRQLFVETAVATNMWDTVEDLVVSRFSAPAGAPQDGFFATVDQALMIQNDKIYQSWIKANEGNLIQRLMTITDSKQFAQQMYLSILSRMPEDEEIEMVTKLLNLDAQQRDSVVQELVWGLLASSEFRFCN